MHRSRIEWVDDTWNPITGCLDDCEYCYARKRSWRFAGDVRRNMRTIQYHPGTKLQILDEPFVADTGGKLNYPFGFEPTYHQYRIDYPTRRKNQCNILVGEAGEMCGCWVPDRVLIEIFDSCRRNALHNYLFLTIHPERYVELQKKGFLPDQETFWYGITVTRGRAPELEISGRFKRFICIEPILGGIQFPESDIPITDWIIIGAETANRRGRVVPQRKWIDEIVEYADRFRVPVFMKDSLKEIMGGELRKDIPDQLQKRELSPMEKARRSGVCSICKKVGWKKDMVAILARFKRGEQPKQICHICRKCFVEFCKKNSIEISDTEELRNEKEKLSQNN